MGKKHHYKAKERASGFKMQQERAGPVRWHIVLWSKVGQTNQLWFMVPAVNASLPAHVRHSSRNVARVS